MQSDLLHLIKCHCADDPQLLDLVLRLLVNLTNPELLLFREELPEDKVNNLSVFTSCTSPTPFGL